MTKPGQIGGLLIGLLVALVAVGIAASSTGPTPAQSKNTVSASIASTAAVTALPATAIPLPTLTSTAAPTALPTPTTFPTPTVADSSPMPPPTPSPEPTAAVDIGQVIGYSVLDQPIMAYRIGDGPLKVALIGDIHGEFEANTYTLTLQLLEHFQSNPEKVPAGVSLWIMPTMNPDGLATGHRWNANDVDLNRNADTDLDGCAGNDWSPDTVGREGTHEGAGGAYPFSEPEARAIRDFLDDAWVAVFYHSAAEAIFLDTCQRHAPTARLAEALSEGTGYPVPEEGWTGYRITGDFGDYLAGEGVAAVTVELTDHQNPEFERNLEGVRALLSAVDEIVSAEAVEVGAEYVWLDEDSAGSWRYEDNTFLHPLALEVIDDTAYILDGGRVLAQDLAEPTAPDLLLAPSDYVEQVYVVEPLDLAADGDSLLALDRASDVYRYDVTTGEWTVERYDRPSGTTSDHYFVALSATEGANYLLDTTHEQVLRFADGQRGAAWVKLPRSRDVDVSASDDDLYALTRKMNSPIADLLRYRSGRQVSRFEPNVDLMHPRQVVATEAAVYVLDRAGRRLLALDPESGELLTLYQFTDRRDVSTIWSDPSGERLILAGRDTLYFVDKPERTATIEGGPVFDSYQPHDLALLEELRGYSAPIEGAHLTNRDFQMPGAPRHYRLGVHEGMDFYTHTSGVPVNRGTPVLAVADGVVVRAMVDHQPLTAAQAEAWYNQSISAGYTPPEVLDGYRGMQIWIDHSVIEGDGNGVISRYAHLSAIEPGIVEGVEVMRGQVIGQVGNSGTPASVSSETIENHLHMELWVNDHFVGQFLRPIEAREWLEKILR